MRNFFKQIFTTAIGTMIGFGAIVFGLVIVVPVMIAILMGSKHAKGEPIKNNSILNLQLKGQIVERHKPIDFELSRQLFAEDKTLGLWEVTKALDLAKADKRIAGVYLEIGDFEAGWATLTALRRSLEAFTASGKWIVAYTDKMDEKGYYIGSAASQLYMEPYGDMEFNGLTVQDMFVKGLLDKLEVEPQIFRVGRFKAAVEPLILDKMSVSNRLQTQTLADDLWAVVRAAAAKETKLAPARIDEIANKLEVVSAESAKNAKLITDTKFVDEVEDGLKEATVGKDNDLELVSPTRYLKDSGDHGKHSGKKIAVIYAEGEIHGGESTRDSIGSDDLREDIEEAKADDDVAAIVVRINSPGGDALASDVIWRAMRESDDELPVVVSMGDVAASGGYYMASASRYIFAEPTTITGSIGVFGIMFNGEKFFKHKAFVNFDSVVTNTHADIGTMTRKVTPEEAKIIQGGVDRVYKRFLDVVQDGRGYEERKDLEEIAEGRVWTGTRAKELGLVDELGGLNAAIAKAAEFAEIKDYQIEFFPTDVDPLKHLIERFAGDAFTHVFGVSFSGSMSKLQKVKSQLEPQNGIFARMPYDLNIH
jgi:protease-4